MTRRHPPPRPSQGALGAWAAALEPDMKKLTKPDRAIVHRYVRHQLAITLNAAGLIDKPIKEYSKNEIDSLVSCVVHAWDTMADEGFVEDEIPF